MKFRISLLIQLIVFIAVFIGIGILAAPVNPNQNPLVDRGSTHHNPDPQYQQGFFPFGGGVSYAAVPPILPEQQPLQPWFQDQSNMMNQITDQYHWQPSSQINYGSNPILDQRQWYDTTGSHYLWHEQQLRNQLSDPSGGNQHNLRLLSLGNEHHGGIPTNTIYDPSSLSSLPQSINIAEGVHDTYYVDPGYETEWLSYLENSDPTFPSASTSTDIVGGQEGWIDNAWKSHDHFTPSMHQQAGHIFVTPEQHITPSTAASTTDESYHQDANSGIPPSTSSGLSCRGRNEGESKLVSQIEQISKAIQKWVPFFEYMQNRWEEPYSPFQRRWIIGTIVARWADLKASEKLPANLTTQIKGLRNALREESARAILNGDAKVIDDLAKGSTPTGSGNAKIAYYRGEEKEAMDRYQELKQKPEAASSEAIQCEKKTRVQERLDREYEYDKQWHIGTGLYADLKKFEKKKLNSSVFQWGDTYKLNSSITTDLLQYLMHNMTPEDMDMLSPDLEVNRQAWYKAFTRWRQSPQQQKEQ